MKICQMAPVETNLAALGPLCQALAAAGHEVVATCGYGVDGRVHAGLTGPGVELHRVPARRRVDRSSSTLDVAALVDYLVRERYDVLHVHGRMVGLRPRLAARLAGVPVVITQADGFSFHAGARPLARAGMRRLEQQLSRHLTDVVVTVNREDHELAVRHRFRRDSRQLVHIPGAGVDTERFAADRTAVGMARRDQLRASLGTTESDTAVVFVGRLVGEKGLDDLADAFIEVGTGRRLVLWLVGDVPGNERDRTAPARVARRLADHALADRVRFVGRRDDIADLLRASDVFVLPSLREGMPASLLEAMASEVAVVATDIRGSREVVEDGRTGLLVPTRQPRALASAIERLADDAELRRSLGRAARRVVVAGYTVDASLAPLLGMYADLAEATTLPSRRTERAERDVRRTSDPVAPRG